MGPTKPPGTSHSSAGFGQGGSLATIPSNATMSSMSNGVPNPNFALQSMHDLASKRISTLDYLRKAHEGRVYWFNTLHFSAADLAKLPSSQPRQLARRATNFLLLGFSLPTVLDMNANSAPDYLKALNTILSEFETYQSIHPPDGSGSSSLSRGRIPQMFKRATGASSSSKGRRASTVQDLGLSGGLNGINGSDVSSIFSGSDSGPSSAFPSSENELLPGEEYQYLLTPSLPFDPDFFETFATLCDVLIDCYTKIMSLINSPEACTPLVGELFSKADARVRKLVCQGIVREFEDAGRSGVKSEVAGVGRVVLGGLM
ncbi:hypothetical protein K402DRAFT_329752 [Aulographum hederae CBS 113979]|uniref:Uncharacterized protein n=1 Tax=Aulographum hederae CBS 113979 TaxID=1176131 RepID=A0A6G1H4Z6_9PEZI|nr:hypothetical protein K402DRAFT_329752 [Aulographum hederae CBS 113979]